MIEFDMIVIGAGPGGYVCAIRGAQLGLKVACVEGRGKLGGTCLNVGCIPSKALLHASEAYHDSTKNFHKMGIEIQPPKVNWPHMLKYKQQMIDQNTLGVEYLFKKNKIEYIKGWASIKTDNSVLINGREFRAKNIVIATGSEASSIEGIEVNQTTIVDSTGALELKEIPKTLVVIGGGVIGLELSSVFSRLGSNVTVIEYLDRLVPEMDFEVASEFQKILRKQGINFILKSAVKTVKKKDNKLEIKYSFEEDPIIADIVLVATGRKPFTKNLISEGLRVETDEKGRIIVDSFLRTGSKTIYAIGDVVSGPMLAHKAEDEGISVAETIAGQLGHVNYNLVPSVVYTSPEVASVGMTEENLKIQKKNYKIGKFSFRGNGRAKVNFSAEGFVKILTDAKTDRILGAHIIGPSAGDLIHEVCVAMEFGASSEDLARTCHAHPTTSEAVREAALACQDGAIHS